MVTIYMIGEIEMEATLEWDAAWLAWTARPVAGTIRDNHETWDLLPRPMQIVELHADGWVTAIEFMCALKKAIGAPDWLAAVWMPSWTR